jgi:alpha-amylase
MFYTLRNVFQGRQSMNQFEGRINEYRSKFPDWSVLGTFVDNHDNARFLAGQSDYQLYKNALTYVILAEGIPIVYYGSEQGYMGGNDPNNREDLWRMKWSTTNQLYAHIATLNQARKQMKPWTAGDQVQRYSDDNFYAFSRGMLFVALTNLGSNSGTTSRQITYHPFHDGQQICNIFYPKTDCLRVSSGKFTVFLLNGESKVYIPA